MDNIKQRLLQYAKTQKIGMMKFYEKISVSQSNFSGKGGDSALSTDKIIHILITFDDINPDWLLLGKGEMLRQNSERNNTLPEDSSIIAYLERKVSDLQAKLLEANRIIGRLEYQLHQEGEKTNSASAPTDTVVTLV